VNSLHRFAGVSLVLSTLLLASCATTLGKQVDNLSKVNDSTKAYLVVRMDNQSGKAFLASKGEVTVWIDKAFTNSNTSLAMVPKDNSPYITYEVVPGTYRIYGINVTKRNLVSGTVFSYLLERPYYTFFKVNAGEVVYLGSYMMIDKDDTLTTEYDLPKVKDEMVAKYPQLEGFHWVGLLEDRPSF